MEDKIPEIDVKIQTITVKGGVSKKMTIRNMFYTGIVGKIKTIFYWLINNKGKSFKEYLDSPVTYHVDLSSDFHCYHSIDAEKELEQLLIDELNKGES